MLGRALPIELIRDVVCERGKAERYMLDYRDSKYLLTQLNDERTQERLLVLHERTQERLLVLHECLPRSIKAHLREWFTIDHLPPPEQCTYIQCPIESSFFPTRSICLLVGYAEKYRKYFYPLQIDLDQMSIYLTGQPIYYNFNQAVALDCLVDPPVLRIHSFSKANKNSDLYQPKLKSDVDPYWEPPINLIRTFTMNPSPTIYRQIT